MLVYCSDLKIIHDLSSDQSTCIVLQTGGILLPQLTTKYSDSVPYFNVLW